MRWAGHVTRLGTGEVRTEFFWRGGWRPDGRRPLAKPRRR